MSSSGTVLTCAYPMIGTSDALLTRPEDLVFHEERDEAPGPEQQTPELVSDCYLGLDRTYRRPRRYRRPDVGDLLVHEDAATVGGL